MRGFIWATICCLGLTSLVSGAATTTTTVASSFAGACGGNLANCASFIQGKGYVIVGKQCVDETGTACAPNKYAYYAATLAQQNGGVAFGYTSTGYLYAYSANSAFLATQLNAQLYLKSTSNCNGLNFKTYLLVFDLTCATYILTCNGNYANCEPILRSKGYELAAQQCITDTGDICSTSQVPYYASKLAQSKSAVAFGYSANGQIYVYSSKSADLAVPLNAQANLKTSGGCQGLSFKPNLMIFDLNSCAAKLLSSTITTTTTTTTDITTTTTTDTTTTTTTDTTTTTTTDTTTTTTTDTTTTTTTDTTTTTTADTTTTTTTDTTTSTTDAPVTTVTTTTTTTTSSSSTVPTLSCPTNGYLVIGNSGSSKGSSLYSVDISTGQLTLVTSSLGGDAKANAIGYNALDNSLYGVLWQSPQQLIKIGANGQVANVLTLSSVSSGSWNSGDVDEQGNMWLGVFGRDWMQIELSTLTILDSGHTDSLAYNIADWAYVPGGGNCLYGIVVDGDTNVFLYCFDRTTHIWSQVGIGYGAIYRGFAAVGAVYASADGFLYGSDNISGKIYRFSLDGSTATYISMGIAGTTIDGAHCILNNVT